MRCPQFVRELHKQRPLGFGRSKGRILLPRSPAAGFGRIPLALRPSPGATKPTGRPPPWTTDAKGPRRYGAPYLFKRGERRAPVLRTASPGPLLLRLLASRFAVASRTDFCWAPQPRWLPVEPRSEWVRRSRAPPLAPVHPTATPPLPAALLAIYRPTGQTTRANDNMVAHCTSPPSPLATGLRGRTQTQRKSAETGSRRTRQQEPAF
jgi:hypothetical protein